MIVRTTTWYRTCWPAFRHIRRNGPIPRSAIPAAPLVELFAWLADTILYRANLIPEKQRLAFLKLLGQPMQAAAAAQGIISLSLDPASTTAASLLSGAAVPGAFTFETLSEIILLPVTGQGYIKVPLPPGSTGAAVGLVDRLEAALWAEEHTRGLYDDSRSSSTARLPPARLT